MQKQGKQIQIYRNEILQMSIWRHEGSKVKIAESQNFKCQYVETGKQN